jgi:hypothetical protein
MIHNQTVLLVACPRGNLFRLPMRNLGWSAAHAGYVSEFDFEGVTYRSLFKAEKYLDQHCATPDRRLVHDHNFLYDELGLIVEDVDA